MWIYRTIIEYIEQVCTMCNADIDECWEDRYPLVCSKLGEHIKFLGRDKEHVDI